MSSADENLQNAPEAAETVEQLKKRLAEEDKKIEQLEAEIREAEKKCKKVIPDPEP